MSDRQFRGTLIVGGGLAGPAAGIWLARAGKRVLLWEKERLPHHKICGEFLSVEACAWLRALGLNLDAEGAATINRMRLVAGGRTAEAPLGFEARSLSRHRLDAALLELAQCSGVEVLRGHAARQLRPDGAVLGLHETLLPDTLLLATGKTNLRGAQRPDPRLLPNLIGFKTYLRLTSPQRTELRGHVELIQLADGYAGLQPVERNSANLCFLVGRERLERAGGNFDRLLEGMAADIPHLGRRLHGAVQLLDRPLTISGVPYGYLHRPVPGEPGLRLGDQAAVIPSFAGEGMAIALHSGKLAAQSLLLGDGHYYRRLRRDVAGPVKRAMLVQQLAGRGLPGPVTMQLLGLIPWALPLLARLTRMPERVLKRAGLPA